MSEEQQDPTPADRVASFALSISGWANEYAMLYGGPLYLVGSYLTAESPGDIDIRCMLPREICILYWGDGFDGPSWNPGPGWFARKREELKQARRMTRAFGRGGRYRIDFQFQCTLFGDSGSPIMREGKPFLRLDAAPLAAFGAGMGDP